MSYWPCLPRLVTSPASAGFFSPPSKRRLDMTILFVGSEPGDFDACSAAFTVTAGRFRSGLRGANSGYQNEGTTFNLATSPTDIWVSARHWQTQNYSWSSNAY